MIAEPAATPVNSGGVEGDTVPAAMNTVDVIVAFDVSLLVNVTVTPPAGAAASNTTPNETDWPTGTVMFGARLIRMPSLTRICRLTVP